jgi:hypothetical protein
MDPEGWRVQILPEVVFRVRKRSQSNGCDQMIRDLFRIHEQFAAGELNQEEVTSTYLYNMYILAHAGYNTSYYEVIH